MSPYGRSGWYEAKPRVTVEGGVTVAKPGRVSDPDALDLLAAAEMETKPAILSRGRTYARAGQVLNVETDGQSFTASIQGSDRAPYQVQLTKIMISGSDRIHASCTCPYSCDYDWCKHAAALAYVAAFLIDTAPTTRAIWTNQPIPSSVEPLTPEDLRTLRSSAARATFAQRLETAQAVVPWVGEG